MKIGIEHIAIFSKDTKVLSDWYKEIFDGEIVYDNGKGTYFVAFSDKSMIEFCLCDELTSPTDLSKAGIRHIAFSTDDFDTLTKRVIESGVEILKPATVSEKGIGTIFFRDIDGNILHLISRPSPLV